VSSIGDLRVRSVVFNKLIVQEPGTEGERKTRKGETKTKKAKKGTSFPFSPLGFSSVSDRFPSGSGTGFAFKFVYGFGAANRSRYLNVT
jgi:hypothetical protein